MEIIKAEHLGFCNGVKRAINVAKTHAPCLTYKELIHNKKVVDGLKNEGIYPVHDLSVVQSGDNVVIAAHGAAPSDFEKLARIGANVYDATCPMVKKVQEIVREYSIKGYKIIILGDKNHQEVQGICGFSADTPQIAADFDEISLEDGEKVLRAKIDMAANNINMRDPVIYRIVKAPHHSTKHATAPDAPQQRACHPVHHSCKNAAAPSGLRRQCDRSCRGIGWHRVFSEH